MDLKGFANPESILRPAPFWAINSKIEPGEIARQMADMIRVGLSGGFFHSRSGLVTDYLGEEWFACMDAALETAKANDGYLWLYDEDQWPSGNAGGQIAALKNEYRFSTLDAYLIAAGEPLPELSEDQAVRYCYAIRSRDGVQLSEYDPVDLDKIDEASDKERLVFVRTYDAKCGWWGGESHANLMDPEAMREFIKMTHEVYLAKLGPEFGKRIPGIFTDEPSIHHRGTSVAWYEGLPDVYAKWHGRDYWADLPYMFFDGPESRKIRLLMHRTLLRQFLEAYSKPLFDWCEEHGLEHTGHWLGEDAFSNQISCHGGGVMAHYRYQQAPGIDHLCRSVTNHLFTCKQASSAARQLGRSRVLTEIFGVTRHTNTFEDFKWIGDYDLVMGTNFFVPHLTWYSAKGKAKRDYPPVWNYQQTYWDDLRPLNDYFTRIAHATTRGKAKADVLLLHSIEGATADYRQGVTVSGKTEDRARKLPVDAPSQDIGMSHFLDGQMRRALEAILTAGYECDLGDEGYIADLGSIQGDSFVIGAMSYKVVVVPPAVTWRPNTFELLKKFVANGGKVIVLGELPSELDCDDAKAQWIEFAKHPNVLTLPCSAKEIQDGVDSVAPRTFTLRSAGGEVLPLTYLQHRVDGDQEIFFIVNSDRDNSRDYVFTFHGTGKKLVKWDAVEGTNADLNCTVVEGLGMRYCFTLPPSGSLLVTLEPGENKPAKTTAPALTCGAFKALTPCAELDFERKDANVLVLDRISVSYDDGKTFEAEDLEWRIRRGLAEHFDTSAALEWQPWVSVRKHLFDGKGGPIILRYKFASVMDKPKSFIVIEDIKKGKLTVNGTPVDVSNAGWHWDRAFGKVEITDLVVRGENVVDFSVDYSFLTEVEAAYVVGEFGVEMADPFRGKIVPEPKKLMLGAWNDQGYPFYSGRMIYKTTLKAESGQRIALRLVNPSGILYKVRVNGKDAGRILWRPWELDISEYVRAGENQIEIEVVSSLQNTWGPLHGREGDAYRWVGPNAFEWDPDLREEINSFPYGLLGGVEFVTG